MQDKNQHGQKRSPNMLTGMGGSMRNISTEKQRQLMEDNSEAPGSYQSSINNIQGGRHADANKYSVYYTIQRDEHYDGLCDLDKKPSPSDQEITYDSQKSKVSKTPPETVTTASKKKNQSTIKKEVGKAVCQVHSTSVKEMRSPSKIRERLNRKKSKSELSEQRAAEACSSADKTDKSLSNQQEEQRRASTVLAEGSESAPPCRLSNKGDNDDELFEGYLDLMHEPQQAQLATLVMIQSKLNGQLEEVWSNDAVSEVVQLRQMQQTLHSLGRQIEKLNVDAQVNITNNEQPSRTLTSVIEVTAEDAKDISRDTPKQQEVAINDSYLSSDLVLDSGIHVVKDAMFDEKNQHDKQKQLQKVIGKGQSKILQSSLSQSGDISFFDSSQNSELKPSHSIQEMNEAEEDEELHFKSELIKISPNRAAERMTNQKKPSSRSVQKNIEDAMQQQSQGIIRRAARPEVVIEEDEMMNSNDPGFHLKRELQELMLIFKDVDGDAEAMDEYLHLMREMSEQIANNSFEQNALINELGIDGLSSFKGNNSSLASHRRKRSSGMDQSSSISNDKFEIQDERKMSGNSEQPKKEDVLESGGVISRRKKDFDDQSMKSLSSFAKLANQNEEDDHSDNSSNNCAKQPNVKHSGFALKAQAEQKSMAQSDGQRGADEDQSERGQWLHAQNIIREDSKEWNPSSRDSKENSGSALRGKQMSAEQISEESEDVENAAGLAADQTDFDFDDMDELGPSARGSGIIEEAKDEACDVPENDNNKGVLHNKRLVPPNQANSQMKILSTVPKLDGKKKQKSGSTDPDQVKIVERELMRYIYPEMPLKVSVSTQTMKTAEQPFIRKQTESEMSMSIRNGCPSCCKLIRELKTSKLDSHRLKLKIKEVKQRLESFSKNCELYTLFDKGPDQTSKDDATGEIKLSLAHSRALFEQGRACYDALDLAIMIGERRIQETKRQLSKFLKEIDDLIETGRPLIKYTKLAHLAFKSDRQVYDKDEGYKMDISAKSLKQAQSPERPVKVCKSFDLTRCIADCFQIIIDRDKFTRPVEFLASISRREQLPCLWSVVGNEERLQQAIFLLIEQYTQPVVRSTSSNGPLAGDKLETGQNQVMQIKVELHLVEAGKQNKNQEYAAQGVDMQDLSCQIQISRKFLTGSSDDHQLKSNSAQDDELSDSRGQWLQQQLCRKLVRQLGGVIRSQSSSKTQVQLPLSTQNQIYGVTGAAINKFTFIVRKSTLETVLSSASRSRSSLIYGSISSSGEVVPRGYKTSSSNKSIYGRQPSLYGGCNKGRPMVTLPFIEVNQVNLKMQEVTAIIRRNERRVDRLVQQAKLRVDTSNNEIKRTRSGSELASKDIHNSSLVQHKKKDAPPKAATLGQKEGKKDLSTDNLTPSIGVKGQQKVQKSSFFVANQKQKFSPEKKSESAVPPQKSSFSKQPSQKEEIEEIKEVKNSKNKNLTPPRRFESQYSIMKQASDKSHSANKFQNQAQIRRESSLKEMSEKQSSHVASNDKSSNRGHESNSLVSRKSAVSGSNGCQRNNSKDSRKADVKDSQHSQLSKPSKKKLYKKNILQHKDLHEQSSMGIRARQKTIDSDKKSGSHKSRPSQRDSRESQKEPSAAPQPLFNGMKIESNDGRNSNGGGSREASSRSTPRLGSNRQMQTEGRQRSQFSRPAASTVNFNTEVPRQRRSSLEEVQMNERPKALMQDVKNEDAAVETQSALASSGSGESSFSICLSEGDPDRAQSLAAQDHKIQSLLGSVFNGSNLGGSIFGSSLGDDSEMSSDDASSISSANSSRSSCSQGNNKYGVSGQQITSQRPPPRRERRNSAAGIQRKIKSGSLNVSINGNNNVLNMEEIKECSSDTDPTSDKDLSKHHYNNQSEADRSFLAIRDRSLNQQIAEVDSESDEEVKQNELKKMKSKASVKRNQDSIKRQQSRQSKNSGSEKFSNNQSQSKLSKQSSKLSRKASKVEDDDEGHSFNVLATGKTAEDLKRLEQLLLARPSGQLGAPRPKNNVRLLLKTKSAYEALFFVERQLKKLRTALERACAPDVGQEEAQEVVEQAYLEQFDLVLLDMQVGDLDALQLCQNINECYKKFSESNRQYVKTPVIFGLTQEYPLNPSLLIRMGHAGFDLAYSKPLTADQVKEIFSKLE